MCNDWSYGDEGILQSVSPPVETSYVPFNADEYVYTLQAIERIENKCDALLGACAVAPHLFDSQEVKMSQERYNKMIAVLSHRVSDMERRLLLEYKEGMCSAE